MNGHSLGAAVRRLRESLAGSAGGDAALLDRFAADRDPAAFAALVARYGPLVLGVCRRAVGDPHLAEDVFQAVFLVLARKAGSIRRRDSVGSWLYGVAYRLARKAASRERQRPEVRFEHPPAADAPGSPSPEIAAWHDLLAALDQELHRLPDRLRAPLLLCYYDGCTRDEAARRLGWSLGTLRRRLDQARDLLRVRLTARGATLGAGLLATVLATRGARAAVPATLARITIDAAEAFEAGGLLTGPAGQLAEEGLHMLGMSKVRAGVALAILVGGLAVGGGALFGVGADRPDAPNKPPVQDKPPVADAPGSPNTGLVLRHGGAPFRHGSDVINVLVTPDGKTILTQGYSTVRLWDAATGRDQGVLELPDDSAVFWTGSLTPDGKTLITTRRNGTAQVWDLATRKMTRSFRLAAPPFDVNGARCVHSPDGKAIAVVTMDGSIRVCDVTAGREMDQVRSHSDAITAATFTPDSKEIVVASGPMRFVHAWDLASGKAADQYRPATANVANLAFSADGKWLAAAGVIAKPNEEVKTTISITEWQATNKPNTLGGNSVAEQLMAFSPDARYLFAPDRRSEGRILTQWDLGTGRAIRQYPEHRAPIQSVAFTPDGKTLITPDTSVRFWDWKTGQEVRPTFGGGEHCYALTPDGKAIAEGGTVGFVRLWDATTGAEIRRFDVPPAAGDVPAVAAALAVSRDAKLLAAQSWPLAGNPIAQPPRKQVCVWELAAGKLLHVFDDRIGPTPSALVFGPGNILASAGIGRPVVYFDVATGGESNKRPSGDLPARELTFAPDEKGVFIWDGGTDINPVNVPRSTGEPLHLSPTESIHVNNLKFTPDGRLAVANGTTQDGAPLVCIRSTTEQWSRCVRNLPRPAARVAFDPDRKLIAVAPIGENPPVLILDVETGREVKRFTGLRGRATWLAFAPDGKRVYAASSDATVLAWDTDVVAR